jgi:hypothetical protein
MLCINESAVALSVRATIKKRVFVDHECEPSVFGAAEEGQQLEEDDTMFIVSLFSLTQHVNSCAVLSGARDAQIPCRCVVSNAGLSTTQGEEARAARGLESGDAPKLHTRHKCGQKQTTWNPLTQSTIKDVQPRQHECACCALCWQLATAGVCCMFVLLCVYPHHSSP